MRFGAKHLLAELIIAVRGTMKLRLDFLPSSALESESKSHSKRHCHAYESSFRALDSPTRSTSRHLAPKRGAFKGAGLRRWRTVTQVALRPRTQNEPHKNSFDTKNKGNARKGCVHIRWRIWKIASAIQVLAPGEFYGMCASGASNSRFLNFCAVPGPPYPYTKQQHPIPGVYSISTSVRPETLCSSLSKPSEFSNSATIIQSPGMPSLILASIALSAEAHSIS